MTAAVELGTRPVAAYVEAVDQLLSVPLERAMAAGAAVTSLPYQYAVPSGVAVVGVTVTAVGELATVAV